MASNEGNQILPFGRREEQQQQKPAMRKAEQKSQALVSALINMLREIKDPNKVLLLILVNIPGI